MRQFVDVYPELQQRHHGQTRSSSIRRSLWRASRNIGMAGCQPTGSVPSIRTPLRPVPAR